MNMTSQERGNKAKVTDLAVLGGPALFPDPIAVGRPNIPDPEGVLADIRNILSTGVLSNDGPYVQRFESEVSKFSGVRHCIATCNATAALELVAQALGVTGEVIVPSFTFIATAHALSWQGLTPVFVDVDPVTHTMDPRSVEEAITARTSSICAVHLWGNTCGVNALQEIADRYKLSLWFDSAHAFPCSPRPLGSEANNVEVFSFHATKFLNAFEGGAIVTDDPDLARKLREMRNFGFSEKKDREVVSLGLNAKMPETSAAMGLGSLRGIEQAVSMNRSNLVCYRTFLEECLGISIVAPIDPEHTNCQYVVAEVDDTATGVSRDDLLSILRAEGVLAQRYFYPGCHLAAPYRNHHARQNRPLPVTSRLARSVLVLPTGAAVSHSDIRAICSLIRFVLDYGQEVEAECARRGIRL